MEWKSQNGKIRSAGAILLFLFFLGVSIPGRVVFAYSDTTTHPALTDEIVDFYNFLSAQKLSDEEKEWVVQGSMDEDTPPRWVNHFLDPFSREGWTGEHTGRFSSSTIQEFSSAVLSPHDPVAADRWVQDQELQTKYSAYRGNRTWDRALYEYAKRGDRQAAYYTLGYVLHLIEDMTVPDHTRNDTHAHALRKITGDDGSPYENYTAKYTRENLHVAEPLFQSGLRPFVFNDITESFLMLSRYSNNYFFSKDTIYDLKYQLPKIIREDGKYSYGLDREGKEFLLTKIINLKLEGSNYQFKKTYKLEISDEQILESYFQRLSREAVLAGAGVIDLFHRETRRLAEHPEEIPELYQPEGVVAFVKNRIPSPVGEGFRLAKAASAIKNFAAKALTSITSVFGNVFTTQNQAQEAALGFAQTEQTGEQKTIPSSAEEVFQRASFSDDLNTDPVAENQGQENEIDTEFVELQLRSAAEQKELPQEPRPEKQSQNEFSQNLPTENNERTSNIPQTTGYSGGGSPPNPPETLPEQTNETLPALDTTPPQPPIIISPANFSAVFTATQITFTGTAEARSTITTDFSSATTTSDENANWSLALTFPQGTTTIAFFARDAAGNLSSAATTTLVVDSVAPVLTNLAVNECSQSLRGGSCLIATTTVTFSWSDNSTDTASYLVDCARTNGAPCGTDTFPKTLATLSAILAIPDMASSTISISAQDANGNRSATSTTLVETHSLPVVINEIAWAGTPGSVTDEWIELKNNTVYTLSLAGWTLSSQSDAYPAITFSGTIAPNGYFLIERQADDTISDITADFINNFGGNDTGNGLSNTSAEILVLAHASSTVDKTALCASSNGWCGGTSGPLYYSMERIDPLRPGTLIANWGSNNGIIQNGKDKNGTALHATPRARNSLHYLITQSDTLNENKTLLKEHSPYIVPQGQSLSIAEGKTLTIRPGVVIKFGIESSFLVRGAIVANGTAEDRIVFTGFKDDAHAGDTNGDGMCDAGNASSTASCPAAADWKNVVVVSTSEGSSFTNTVFRYGGRWFIGQHNLKNMLRIDGTNAAVANSMFEYSDFHGLELVNSTSTISANVIRYNNGSDPTVSGVHVSGGAPTITGNTFTNNKRGLWIESATSSVTVNTFASSTSYAVIASNSTGSFSGNSGSANGINGILLEGTVAQNGATTTLAANTLAYVLGGSGGTPRVPAGAVLRFLNGVVVKGMSDSILQADGTLVADGLTAGDIVFTSIKDDSIGGDTNGDGVSSSPAAGDWTGILINSGGTARLNGAHVFYGGLLTSGGDEKGGIRALNSTVTVSNSLFRANYMHGLYIQNGTSTITNTIFDRHTDPVSALQSALALYGYSNSTLETVVFSNNRTAVRPESTAQWTTSNISFSNNTATSSPPDTFP